MGGKNKGNRTKNNARPSSSARSAELLQNQTATFFGLGTVKDGTVSIMPGIGNNEAMEVGDNTDFQLVLKKMAKKDATTKLKALQEFTELCAQADTANVKAILPNWVRIYTQLCCDNEHRVREAVQRSHKAVIAKVKRYLAPFLKEIIGPWFTAQYDTYAPAASAAVAAFEESFSPSKMTEAIAFCQDEILNYFYTNLAVLTPQTSGNPKTCSAEELEDRYRRLVSSSLQGYAFYLQKIPQKNLEEATEQNIKILNSAKFWKLAQHKDPAIRFGFFKAIISLSQFGVELIKPKSSQLASAIFSHLSEEDSMVLPVLWEAVLSAVVAVPECGNSSAVEKQLIPKLFQLLRCGGKGHALTIFPKLLPLLSKLPSQAMGDIPEFLSKLFSSMRTGLLDPTVNRSLSESRVVAGTFVECLQYKTMIHRGDKQLVENLIKDELIAAISACLKQTTPIHTTQPLLCHIAFMFRSWYKNNPTYDYATRSFWSLLNQSFDDQLNSSICQESIEITLKNQVEVLTIFKNPSKFAPKSNKERVRFKTESENTSTVAKDVKEVLEPLFDEALDTFVKELVKNYVDLFNSYGSSLYIKTILELADVFDLKIIYPGEDELFALYNKVLHGNVTQEVIIRVGIKMLDNVNEENQVNILNSLVAVEDLDFAGLSRGLLSCLTKSVRQWIKSEEYSNKYLQLLDAILTDDVGNVVAAETLSGFLAPEFLLDKKLGKHIVSKVSAAVTNKKCCQIIGVFINGFGSELCASEEYDDLIVNLFLVSCDPNNEEYTPFLKTPLLKFKYFRMAQSTSLISRVANVISLKHNDAAHLVTIINLFIEILYDINIYEVCEQEEIEDVMPIIKIFLEPPASIVECSAVFKKLAVKSKELSGDCSLAYYNLKHKNEVSSELEVESFRRKYSVDNVSNVGCVELVEEYLQWLEMAASLISQVLMAYPLTYRVVSMAKRGKYKVGVVDDSNTEENDNLNDEVVIGVTHEEWAELQEEQAVQKAFLDEYCDVNMVTPIVETVLLVVENAAALCSLRRNYPEIEQLPTIAKKSNEIFKMVQKMLALQTPMEMEYVYNLAQDLVKYEGTWAAFLPSLQQLFYRQFKMAQVEYSSENIKSSVSEILNSNSLLQDLEAIAKLTAIVQSYAHCISLDDWQIIFIQLDNLIKNMHSADNLNMVDEKSLLTAAMVSSFFVTTQDCFLNCLERKDEERILPESVRMWNEVVEKELWNQIFIMWRYLTEILQSAAPDYDHLQVLSDKDITHIECGPVMVRRLCEGVLAGLHLRQPEPIEAARGFAQQCCHLMLSPQVGLQITAFRVLLSMVPELVQADTVMFQAYAADNEDKELFTRVRDCDWSINQLEEVLRATQTVVDAMLSDLKMGHTCIVQPHTDAFTYTHGYLLLWCVIMEMCGEAHVALRFQYAAWLKQNAFLPVFLKAAFNLMPTQVIHGENAKDTAHLFEGYGDLCLNGEASSSWIEQRACFVYRMCLQRLPAAVREWWSEKEHHVASLISKTTSLHVSPILIASELKNVQNPAMAELENVTVVVSLPAREVIGTFSIDDTSMQIVISLPTNYPLGMIKVDYKSHSAMPKAWRISMFLMHRNGSLRDALALWKSDLDKKFEGVDDCKICYSILHGPNFDIPKQACKTCHKKFHSACLLKWFTTSNKSTCPHCRNQY